MLDICVPNRLVGTVVGACGVLNYLFTSNMGKC